MKLKSLLLVLLIMAVPVYSQSLSGIPGAFADIGFGAKPVGMGGAFVGLADDVNAVIWNPAGLYNQTQRQASFTYTSQLGLIDYHYLAASSAIGEGRTVGVGIITSGDKALREWTFQAAYAQKLFMFSVGAAVKVRYASFGNNSLTESQYRVFSSSEITNGMANQVQGSAIGFGLDIGLMYELTPAINLGLVVKDLLAPVSWDTKTAGGTAETEGKYSETIPTELTVGAAVNLVKNLLITSDYSPSLYTDGNDIFRTGGQLNLYNIVYVRSGMQFFINDLDDEKFIFGLGLDLTSITDLNINIDYAYLLEDIANTQRLSLGIKL